MNTQQIIRVGDQFGVAEMKSSVELRCREQRSIRRRQQIQLSRVKVFFHRITAHHLRPGSQLHFGESAVISPSVFSN